MTVSKARREDVEKLLNQGLRQRWYPIAPSWMVQENPLGVMRLSEDLAIWRDASGTPHVIEDRCPHRGARLSLGWNLGNRLACWYHGVEVDHEGMVVRVPAVEKCPMEGKRKVRNYPAQEVQGRSGHPACAVPGGRGGRGELPALRSGGLRQRTSPARQRRVCVQLNRFSLEKSFFHHRGHRAHRVKSS